MDDSDAESEVINPLYQVRVPTHWMGPNGPTPPWAHDIWRWSRQKGQRPLFGMERRFYDLREGGIADRALLVIARQTRDIGEQAQATTNQMDLMRAAVERAERRTQEVVRDYQERQTALEARLPEASRHD